jgi:hypothetical protein
MLAGFYPGHLITAFAAVGDRDAADDKLLPAAYK